MGEPGETPVFPEAAHTWRGSGSPRSLSGFPSLRLSEGSAAHRAPGAAGSVPAGTAPAVVLQLASWRVSPTWAACLFQNLGGVPPGKAGHSRGPLLAVLQGDGA